MGIAAAAPDYHRPDWKRETHRYNNKDHVIMVSCNQPCTIRLIADLPVTGEKGEERRAHAGLRGALFEGFLLSRGFPSSSLLLCVVASPRTAGFLPDSNI